MKIEIIQIYDQTEIVTEKLDHIKYELIRNMVFQINTKMFQFINFLTGYEFEFQALLDMGSCYYGNHCNWKQAEWWKENLQGLIIIPCVQGPIYLYSPFYDHNFHIDQGKYFPMSHHD